MSYQDALWRSKFRRAPRDPQQWPAMLAAKTRWILGGFVGRRFDRRYGVDTGGVLRRDQMQTVGGHGGADRGADYAPVPPRTFRLALERIPERDFSEFVFIDFGCGKGRALLLAAGLRNFKRVIGVEHAPELVEVAARNLRSWRGPKRCKDVEAICADVFEFEMPPQPYVLFMAGPFGGDLTILQKMLDKLAADLRARPRRAYVVFLDGIRQPLPHGAMNAANFRLLTRHHGERYRFDAGTLTTPLHFAVYRHEP